MRKVNKIIAICLAAASLISIAGCSGGSKQQADNTIVWYMKKPVENLDHQESVEAEANKMIAESLDAKLHFNMIDAASWEQKTKLLGASKDSVDLVMTANWTNKLIDNVKNGSFMELNDLLDKYGQDIVAKVDPRAWDAVTFDGKIMAIPAQQAYSSPQSFVFKKDLVEKYNFDYKNCKTLNDLEPFLAQIKANEPTLVILVFSLLIVILGIILSFFMARKIYMPFGKLYNEIAKNDVNINELENIKMIFHKNNETLQNYERQILDESKVVKRNAINRLLDSSEELSESEIEKIFSYLSINMTQNFIVAVLCVDCIDGKNIYNDPLITYALYNIALEVIRGKYKAEGEQILGNRVAVIINVPDGKDFFAEIYKIMQDIIKHMVDNFDVSISVSISEPIQRIDELSAAALAAKQNLLYRFNYGYGQFFTEQTVSINKNNTRQTFSAAYEELLIGSTEERDKIDSLKKIIDEIRSMNYLNSFIECLRLSNILRDKLKLDVELALDNNISNFAINQTLDEFYNEACEKLSKKYMNSVEKMEEDTKTLHIVSEAKAYIEKNFSNSDANIVWLSEELKISQRKLSEMFRKETGMSFVAYLTRVRIDKAKEYILDDKFDIKEISSMVGISNPTYFYKLFKSQCDVTPTQYKKIFGSDRSK